MPRERPPSPKRTLPLAPSATPPTPPKGKAGAPASPNPRWTPALLEAIAEGERKVTAARLAQGDDHAPIAAAEAALARGLELARAALAKDPAPMPIACGPRCPSCCVAKVVVTAPEILRIAEHLRATRDEAALAALLERARAADAVTRGLSRAARRQVRVPCPLLEGGSCSVHPVRPLLCAGWSSLDVGACERYFEAPADAPARPVPPVYAPAYEVASAVLAGLGKGCFDEGLDGSLLELVAALRIALERPNAKDRWRRQLPVFALARDDEPRASSRGGAGESEG